MSAAVVKCGHADDDDAFDASENILAGASRRQLTTLAAGNDIGGVGIQMTITTTDGNLDDLTQGNIELIVLYAIAPTL